MTEGLRDKYFRLKYQLSETVYVDHTIWDLPVLFVCLFYIPCLSDCLSLISRDRGHF